MFAQGILQQTEYLPDVTVVSSTDENLSVTLWPESELDIGLVL